MTLPLVVLALVLPAAAPSDDFRYEVITTGNRGEQLGRKVIAVSPRVEACLGAQRGPVSALLFKTHDGLFVEVRAAPGATKPCLEAIYKALDVSDVAPHEQALVTAGWDLERGVPKFPTNGMQAIDRDDVPDLEQLFAGEGRPDRERTDEVFAHMPLLQRCPPRTYKATISIGADGAVVKVDGVSNTCVRSVLEGLRFKGPGRLRLELRLSKT